MRKLALSAGSFSAAVIVSAYFYVPVLWSVITGVAFACFLACIIIRKSICRFLQVFFLMFSLGLSFFSIFLISAERTASRYSGETAFSAIVSDYPEINGHYTKVEVILTGKGNRCRAVVYDYYNSADTLIPGDKITFDATFRSMFDSDSSSAAGNLSKGIWLSGRLDSEVSAVKSGYSALFLAKTLSHKILKMIPEVFPDDVVPFLKALVIGRRDDLYSDAAVYPAFLRSGFMHTVAISGMHISFLAGFCLLVFGNDKKGSTISLIIIWLFVFMSGNTPSAARAGIMQTVMLLAPFFRRENDSLTSLSFALILLLLLNPFSAKNIGLQLSFAAVSGIILFSGRINGLLLLAVKNKKLKAVLRYPAGIISSSVGVMAFTIPLSAAHFGYVSVLSIITNTLALWAIPVCFCGTYICLGLFLLFPGLALLMARFLSVLCRYIFSVCSLVSRLPHAVIPFEGFVTILLFVLIYFLFLLFFFSSVSPINKMLFPFLFSVILVISYFSYFRLSGDLYKATVAVMDVGQGECVTMFSGNRAIVVDCGTTDYYVNPGVECADYFYVRGQKNVDALFLTHLHSDHVSGVCHLMELIDVGNVFIPVNIDLSDPAFSEIRRTAFRRGTNVILVDTDTSIRLGDIEVGLYLSDDFSGSNESCMAVLAAAHDKRFLITGDGTYANELQLAEKKSIGDVDVLVAGHHGSNSSSCGYFLDKTDPEYSVFSVGKGNRYGHPSVFVLERMRDKGIKILRTDLCGRVTFLVA